MSHIVIKSMKPRNPVALPASSRRAGAHGPSTAARRAADRRALNRELGQLARECPRPPLISP